MSDLFMPDLNRHTLEADLMRHQQNGDFAAQAETLMALAEIAAHTAFEDGSFHLVQGLYGQAWAAYERLDNKQGIAYAVQEIAESMSREISNHDDSMPLEFDLMHVSHLREFAQSLYIETGDLQGLASLSLAIGHSARRGEIERNAFQQALACYQALDDISMQARTLSILGCTYKSAEPPYRQFLEQALKLYQQIEERQGEADILSRLGNMAYGEKNFATAHALLKTSLTLFIITENLRAFSVVETLGDLLLETEGYAAYHTYSMSTARRLLHLPTDNEEDDDLMISFWESLAKNARKYQDFETAVYAYRQAGLYTVGKIVSDKRAQIYWRWGHIQYHALKRHESGFAMCESAVALMYDPIELTRYQKKLDHMRGEMAAYRRKNPK
jgi:tetratricopeptide (TPR) repeat protein